MIPIAFPATQTLHFPKVKAMPQFLSVGHSSSCPQLGNSEKALLLLLLLLRRTIVYAIFGKTT